MAGLPAADRRRQAGPRDGDRGRGPHADRGPGRIVPVPGAHAADRLVQHPAGLHGEASEKCRDDVDVSVWRCALVPAATTEKERVARNAMLWFFFATGAAIWIALWAAIRLERRLGLTPAPTRNAPVARAAGRHHRCRNMPPARACATTSHLLPARPRLPSRPSAIQPRPRHRVQPPPAGSRPGASADVRLSLRNGPVLTSLRPGQLTVDPACLPDRGGPLRSLRHDPSLTPGRLPPR
jgi:hypothetical protein